MKLPAIQFYPADWRKDPGVQSLSFHDRGVWLEMLCLMHESPRRGYLLMPNGNPMSEDSLSRVIGLDKLILTTTLTTLLELGVSSVDPDTRAIFNRRMVKDEEIRTIRSECGKKGGNPKLLKQTVKQTVNHTSKQNPTPSSSSSSSSSSSEVSFPADAAHGLQISKTSKKEPSGKKDSTPGHAEIVDYFVSRWGEKYGKPYPFAAAGGRNGNAVKTIIIACGGAIEDSKQAIDRFIASDDEFIHGHDLSMLARQITKFMSDKPKGKNGRQSKPNHTGIQEDLRL